MLARISEHIRVCQDSSGAAKGSSLTFNSATMDESMPTWLSSPGPVPACNVLQQLYAHRYWLKTFVDTQQVDLLGGLVQALPLPSQLWKGPRPGDEGGLWPTPRSICNAASSEGRGVHSLGRPAGPVYMMSSRCVRQFIGCPNSQ